MIPFKTHNSGEPETYFYFLENSVMNIESECYSMHGVPLHQPWRYRRFYTWIYDLLCIEPHDNKYINDSTADYQYGMIQRTKFFW